MMDESSTNLPNLISHSTPKAMILAAGLGTRLKPWTNEHPKALATINGKPLLQLNIEYLQRFGIRDVIVNVHHFADQVTDAIRINNGWGSNIAISDETDMVLETGGGLKKASWYFNEEPFVVMNVDILTDMNLSAMISHHQRENPLATLAVTNRQTSRYFLFNEAGSLCGWENMLTGEKKISRPCQPCVKKAFSGIHIISPAIFFMIQQTGRFGMVDVYLELCKTETIRAFDHSASRFIDVGKPESLRQAEQMFNPSLDD